SYFYNHTHGAKWIPWKAYAISFPISLLALPYAIFERHVPKSLRYFSMVSLAALVVPLLTSSGTLPDVFPQRIVVFPGILGLISAAALIASLLERFHSKAVTMRGMVVFALSIVILLNLYFARFFPPTYDQEIARIGYTMSRWPALRERARESFIATDLEAARF